MAKAGILIDSLRKIIVITIPVFKLVAYIKLAHVEHKAKIVPWTLI